MPYILWYAFSRGSLPILLSNEGEFGEVLVLFCLIPIIGDFLILMLATSYLSEWWNPPIPGEPKE